MSLFEIALVLAVIGLLTAGIMKGYDLLQQARLQKTITQIMSVQTAVRMFRDRYGSLPGDCEEASSLWSGKTRDGNGDGIVDGHFFDNGSEASLFWQHLFLSGLIPDFPFLRNHDPEQTHGLFLPKTALGNILVVQSDPSPLEGLWLMVYAPRHGKKYLTPQQAFFIDRHMDNGHPLTGCVRAQSAPGYGTDACVKQGRYNLQSTRPACVVYVLLE